MRNHQLESRMRYVVNLVMWCRAEKVLILWAFRILHTT